MQDCLHIKTIICTLVLVLTACSQDTATNKQLLINDANVFCEIHGLQHWKETPPDNAASQELNQMIRKRVLNVLETDEFRKVVIEMESVEHFSQIYPQAKSKVEKIIGQSWDCPAYKEFYSLTFTSIDGGEGLKVNNYKLGEVDIFITKDGKYLYKNKPIKLTTEALKSILVQDNAPKVELVVELEKGTSKILLEPLYQAAYQLEVKAISVISQ